MCNFDYNEYYKKMAPIYDEVRLDKQREFQNTISVILESVRSANGSLLDIGCGSGRYGEALQNLGFSVIGIDRSPDQVNVANKIITAICGNADDLPFPDHSFDVCTMMLMIHHMDTLTRERSFCEVSRVLKDKTGVFIIKTCSHEDLAARTVCKFWPPVFQNDLLRYPPIESLCAELSDLFVIKTIETKVVIRTSKTDTLREYRLRKSTNLAQLSETAFLDGYNRISSYYADSEYIDKQVNHTYLIAHKSQI